jgi:Mg2+-importing ATPase
MVHRIDDDADPGDLLIRTARHAWSSRPRPVLVATSLGALGLAFAFVLTPLGRAFGFTGLPPSLWLAIFLLVVAYLVAAEAVKHFAMASHRRRLAGLLGFGHGRSRSRHRH